MRFLLGGYTAEMDGAATGIGVLHAGASDDALAGGSLGFIRDAVKVSGSPSWVAQHTSLDVIYAALEGDGAVQAFRRTGDETYVAFGGPIAAGELTCHIAVAPDGGSLIASGWGDGSVVRMTLDAAGVPSTPTVAPAAADPYGDAALDTGFGEGPLPELSAAARALREAAGEEFADVIPDYDREPVSVVPVDDEARPSRAHEAAFLPHGFVATTDMGLDQVRIWRVAAGTLRLVQRIVFPLGSGPRHMIWHPSGHLYVVTELSCEVFALAPDASGTWSIVGGAQLSPATEVGVDRAAELASSRDGEFLYAGVRGSNTIATLRVRGQGETLQPVALAESGVDWPRHHLVVRDTLLVAGERSNEVSSLTLDLRTGVPTGIRHVTAAPSPTCLVPLR